MRRINMEYIDFYTTYMARRLILRRPEHYGRRGLASIPPHINYSPKSCEAAAVAMSRLRGERLPGAKIGRARKHRTGRES